MPLPVSAEIPSTAHQLFLLRAPSMLDDNDLAFLRDATRVMGICGLPFVEQLRPEAPCSLMPMMRAIHRWSPLQSLKVWHLALQVSGHGLNDEALKKLSHPDGMILGVISGLAVIQSAQQLERTLTRALASTEGSTPAYERALLIMLEASVGYSPLETVLHRELVHMARHASEQKNDRRRRAQDRLLRRLKSLVTTEAMTTGPAHKVSTGRTSRHHLQVDTFDRLADATAKLALPKEPRNQPVIVPRRPSACSTPHSMLSRRSSRSSQPLGSPWLETGSPSLEADWDFVEWTDH